MEQSITSTRVYADLMAVFACIALSLAAIGINGMLRFTIEQRIPELGVGIALGASRGNLLLDHRRARNLLIMIGAVLGLGLAFGLSRFLDSLLFGVTSKDPLIFVGAPLVLATVALFSLGAPALKATRIDPAAALRSE